MTRPLSIAGKKFSRLTVVERVFPNDKHGKSRWRCLCECGNEVIVGGSALIKKNTESCGCLWDECKKGPRNSHGASVKMTGAYRSWLAMRWRCFNKNRKEYPRYGGRGITVCERWMKFENFFADMGERPPKHSIERIDNKKGYSPENCKWATPKEQAANRSKDNVRRVKGRFVRSVVRSDSLFS